MGRSWRIAVGFVVASVQVLGLSGLSTPAHAGVGAGIFLGIDNVTHPEGNAGTTSFTFTVSLDSPAPAGGVTFDIATADGTATAPSDYTAKSLLGQTIPAGSSTYSFTVLVNGDTTVEPNETFFVDVSNVVGIGVLVGNGTGTGTIQNDDAVAGPTLSIDNVAHPEGNAGTTSFTFTVSLDSPAPAGGVTFDIATADGTATAPSDYTAKSLLGQTIPAGSSTYSFTVLVNGDTTVEPDETFFVNVSNVTGATVSAGTGTGTIQNDDAAAYPLRVSLPGPMDPTSALLTGAGSPASSRGGAMSALGLPVAEIASLLLLQLFIARRFLRRRETVR